MDIEERVALIERPPTEEIVTRDELIELFKTNSQPKHYIGIEISGFLHLGSLISTGFKINDFLKAGVKYYKSFKILCRSIQACLSWSRYCFRNRSL
jgi:tyrosyl-tRNA synthetase